MQHIHNALGLVADLFNPVLDYVHDYWFFVFPGLLLASYIAAEIAAKIL